MRLSGVGLAALLCLAACEGGGDPVQQALLETSAANHAATVKATATVSPASGPATDTGPAPAEQADQVYVAEMIGHHRAAVAMAETALEGSGDPEVRRMAQATIDARNREIDELQRWEPAPAQSAVR